VQASTPFANALIALCSRCQASSVGQEATIVPPEQASLDAPPATDYSCSRFGGRQGGGLERGSFQGKDGHHGLWISPWMASVGGGAIARAANEHCALAMELLLRSAGNTEVVRWHRLHGVGKRRGSPAQVYVYGDLEARRAAALTGAMAVATASARVIHCQPHVYQDNGIYVGNVNVDTGDQDRIPATEIYDSGGCTAFVANVARHATLSKSFNDASKRLHRRADESQDARRSTRQACTTASRPVSPAWRELRRRHQRLIDDLSSGKPKRLSRWIRIIDKDADPATTTPPSSSPTCGHAALLIVD